MIKFNLYDGKTHQLVKSFTDKQDAYEYQNRIRPDTYLKMERV